MFPQMHLFFTTQLLLASLAIASPLSGDTITQVERPKHKGAAYGVEDCPKTICKDADTKICVDLHTGERDKWVPVYMGNQPARWSD